MELRELSRRVGRTAARKDQRHRDRRRPHDPVRVQRAVSRFSDPARHRQCLRRRLGRAAQVLPTGRQGRISAKADRRRPVQAGLAGARHQARVRGVRGLLPAGARQALRDDQRSRGGDPGRDARARGGRHHLSDPGRADPACQEEPKIMLAPVLSGSWWLEFPGFLRTRTTRSTTSGCARPSASRSTARRSTRPRAAGWARSAATGSTTMSNTRSNGRSSSSMSPRPRS